MRVTSRLAALLPLLAGVLASDVLDLTKDSFQTEIADADLALVEFYAPWCGHCKNLAPHYEEAATTLKDEGIKLAKVDCTVEESVCKDYGVEGYPTLKVFRNGSPTEYGGPRKADGIVSYMRKQNMPVVSELTSDTHDDFAGSDEVVIIAYGDAKHPVPAAFQELAEAGRDHYLFGKVEGDVPAAAGNLKLPALVLYKKFDEGKAVYEGDISSAGVAELSEFARAQSVPLFDEIGPHNFARYADSGLPIAFLFADPEKAEERETLGKELGKLFQELRGKINFVHIDGTKFAEYGKAMGVTKTPGFLIQKLQEQLKYVMPEDVSAKSISSFVTDFVAGKVNPFVKSEAVPETQDAPVYKLVSNGWKQLFGDSEKDIFVEFYAPWCGHCQRLAPTWDTLGEKFANSNVVIAQMDATENDIPSEAGFRVEGFPTIKFRPAGSDSFIDYDGDRSLESLEEFIEKHGKSAAAEKRETTTADEAEEEAAAHDEL